MHWFRREGILLPPHRQCFNVVRNASSTMQEHIYKPKARRILDQSFFIWLFLLLQVGLNVFLAETFIRRGDLWPLIVANLVLAAINVPAVILFWKYYRHSVGKKFIVTYDTLKYVDTKSGGVIEVSNSDVTCIKLVQTRWMSRFPWSFHEYFLLSDSKNNTIIVTSYVMDISEFWLDTLTRKIDSSKLIREEKTLPVF